jgi:hypothetical protein
MDRLIRDPRSALICGKTKSGKTQFVLDTLLHCETGHYRGAFTTVFVLCPNWRYNMTYHSRPWMWGGPDADRIAFLNTECRLQQTLRKLFEISAGTRRLYLIDDLGGRKSSHKRRVHSPRWP